LALIALFLTDLEAVTGAGALGVAGLAIETRRAVEAMDRRLLAVAGALAGVGLFFLADLAADFFTLLGV
jgi:ABC-type cobalamin transport system permease subunit